MKLSALFTEEDAQSEVIGVVLIVAVVVFVLGAIATAVFSLAGEIGTDQPRIDFAFDFQDDAPAGDADCNVNLQSSPDDGNLAITHDGGPGVDENQLSLRDDDGGTITDLSDACSGVSDGDDISPGTTITVAIDDDDTIRIVWEGKGGEETATIGEWTGPDG